jgi:hypothetical protein
MADEDTVLEEAMDNLKEADQRKRATQSLMRSQGMTDGEDYRDLLTRFDRWRGLPRPPHALFYGARHGRSCIPRGASAHQRDPNQGRKGTLIEGVQ